MSLSKAIVISIDGNIGSGKSTLVEYLRRNSPEFVYVDEPLAKWDMFKDASGKTILHKFYDNPAKYAFSFQTMALLSRLTAIREAISQNPGAVIITERSLYTDKLVFARMLFESGEIEDVNYQIYLSWFDAFIGECPIESVIYVKTDPSICSSRILKRLRTGEEGIPLDYLKNCGKYHDLMIEEMQKPTLVLDGNVDIADQPDLQERWTMQIKNFIQSNK